MRGISPAPHLRRFSSTISAYQLLVTYDNAPRHPIREIFIKKNELYRIYTRGTNGSLEGSPRSNFSVSF